MLFFDSPRSIFLIHNPFLSVLLFVLQSSSPKSPKPSLPSLVVLRSRLVCLLLPSSRSLRLLLEETPPLRPKSRASHQRWSVPGLSLGKLPTPLRSNTSYVAYSLVCSRFKELIYLFDVVDCHRPFRASLPRMLSCYGGLCKRDDLLGRRSSGRNSPQAPPHRCYPLGV